MLRVDRFSRRTDSPTPGNWRNVKKNYARLHQKIMKACRKIEAAGGVVSISSVMKETGLSKKNVTRELQIDYTKVSYEALDRVS